MGILSAQNFFSFSRGPIFGEFRPTSCLQVVGGSRFSGRQSADIRSISARGWAETHSGRDKNGRGQIAKVPPLGFGHLISG